MKASEFEEVNVRIAENQPEYETLPAYYNELERSMTFRFVLTEEERNRLYATGELYFKVLTNGEPMQPIALSTNKEDLIYED